VEHFSWLQSVVYPYTNFVIFLVVLIYFSRAPLRKIAQQRQKDYTDLLNKSLEIQQQAQQQLADLTHRMAGLDRELSDLRARLQEEARLEADKILHKGQAMKAYIGEEAERIRHSELAKAEQQLQEQIIHVVQENLARDISSQWHETEQKAFIRQQTGELRKIVS
jgi:F0F1-type ATP synthase membrane subunit b/b'